MPDDNEQTPDLDVEAEIHGDDAYIGDVVGRMEARKIAAEIEQMKSATAKSRREFAITIVSLSIAALAVLGPVSVEWFKQPDLGQAETGPAYARFMVALNQSARQLHASDDSGLESALQELEQAYYELEPYIEFVHRKRFWSLYEDYVTFCRTAQDPGGDWSELNIKERVYDYVASFREILLPE